MKISEVKLKKKHRQHSKQCPHCNSNIKTHTKVCPNCKKYVHDFLKAYEYKERNREVVKELKTGEYTLQDVADKHNISRERVRQIWHKSEGVGFSIRRERSRKLKAIEHKKFLRTIRFNCKACEKPVTQREGHYKHHLCQSCSDILTIEARDPYVWFFCFVCKKKYHPQRNHKAYNSKRNFCTTNCYRDRFLIIEK